MAQKSLAKKWKCQNISTIEHTLTVQSKHCLQNLKDTKYICHFLCFWFWLYFGRPFWKKVTTLWTSFVPPLAPSPHQPIPRGGLFSKRAYQRDATIAEEEKNMRIIILGEPILFIRNSSLMWKFFPDGDDKIMCLCLEAISPTTHYLDMHKKNDQPMNTKFTTF